MRKLPIVLSLGILFSGFMSSPGNAQSINLFIRVQKVEVTNFVINAASGPATSEVKAILKSDSPLNSEIACANDSTAVSSNSKLIQTGPNLYEFDCSYAFQQNASSGLITESFLNSPLGINQISFLPDFSSADLPIVQTDSFGTKSTKLIPLIGIYFGMGGNTGPLSSGAWSIPFAVNPPSNYQVPNFKKDGDYFVVFDSSYVPQKTVVKIDTHHSALDVVCPKPSTNIQTGALRSVIRVGGYTYRNATGIPYGGSGLRGKKVIVNCVTLALLNQQSRAIVGYAENLPTILQIPKK